MTVVRRGMLCLAAGAAATASSVSKGTSRDSSDEIDVMTLGTIPAPPSSRARRAKISLDEATAHEALAHLLEHVFSAQVTTGRRTETNVAGMTQSSNGGEQRTTGDGVGDDEMHDKTFPASLSDEYEDDAAGTAVKMSIAKSFGVWKGTVTSVATGRSSPETEGEAYLHNHGEVVAIADRDSFPTFEVNVEETAVPEVADRLHRTEDGIATVEHVCLQHRPSDNCMMTRDLEHHGDTVVPAAGGLHLSGDGMSSLQVETLVTKSHLDSQQSEDRPSTEDASMPVAHAPRATDRGSVHAENLALHTRRNMHAASDRSAVGLEERPLIFSQARDDSATNFVPDPSAASTSQDTLAFGRSGLEVVELITAQGHVDIATGEEAASKKGERMRSRLWVPGNNQQEVCPAGSFDPGHEIIADVEKNNCGDDEGIAGLCLDFAERTRAEEQSDLQQHRHAISERGAAISGHPQWEKATALRPRAYDTAAEYGHGSGHSSPHTTAVDMSELASERDGLDVSPLPQVSPISDNKGDTGENRRRASFLITDVPPSHINEGLAEAERALPYLSDGENIGGGKHTSPLERDAGNARRDVDVEDRSLAQTILPSHRENDFALPPVPEVNEDNPATRASLGQGKALQKGHKSDGSWAARVENWAVTTRAMTSHYVAVAGETGLLLGGRAIETWKAWAVKAWHESLEPRTEFLRHRMKVSLRYAYDEVGGHLRDYALAEAL